MNTHVLVGGLALLGAAGWVSASARRRLPPGPALLAVLWAMSAALWPLTDTAARTDPAATALWVATVLLCALAVAHSSRTRAHQRLLPPRQNVWPR